MDRGVDGFQSATVRADRSVAAGRYDLMPRGMKPGFE